MPACSSETIPIFFFFFFYFFSSFFWVHGNLNILPCCTPTIRHNRPYTSQLTLYVTNLTLYVANWPYMSQTWPYMSQFKLTLYVAKKCQVGHICHNRKLVLNQHRKKHSFFSWSFGRFYGWHHLISNCLPLLSSPQKWLVGSMLSLMTSPQHWLIGCPWWRHPKSDWLHIDEFDPIITELHQISVNSSQLSRHIDKFVSNITEYHQI